MNLDNMSERQPIYARRRIQPLQSNSSFDKTWTSAQPDHPSDKVQLEHRSE